MKKNYVAYLVRRGMKYSCVLMHYKARPILNKHVRRYIKKHNECFVEGIRWKLLRWTYTQEAFIDFGRFCAECVSQHYLIFLPDVELSQIPALAEKAEVYMPLSERKIPRRYYPFVHFIPREEGCGFPVADIIGNVVGFQLTKDNMETIKGKVVQSVRKHGKGMLGAAL